MVCAYIAVCSLIFKKMMNAEKKWIYFLKHNCCLHVMGILLKCPMVLREGEGDTKHLNFGGGGWGEGGGGGGRVWYHRGQSFGG